MNAIPYIAPLLASSLDGMLEWADQVVVAQKPTREFFDRLTAVGKPLVDLVGSRERVRRDRFRAVCCGLMPRCALETGTVSEPRLSRITRAIFSSKYSIHDLSRCTGEGDENFARFNMPLELGIAMARRFMEREQEHDWLVLVPRGHAYLKFISDLAAYDPATQMDLCRGGYGMVGDS